MVGLRCLFTIVVFMANCYDSKPQMMSFTLCMRFKLNFLGKGLITVKDRITLRNFLYFSVFHSISSTSLWLFKEPDTFFTHLLREPQELNIDMIDTFIPNKWFHLCISFDNSTMILNTILARVFYDSINERVSYKNSF
jgi:hypothetical protein